MPRGARAPPAGAFWRSYRRRASSPLQRVSSSPLSWYGCSPTNRTSPNGGDARVRTLQQQECRASMAIDARCRARAQAQYSARVSEPAKGNVFSHTYESSTCSRGRNPVSDPVAPALPGYIALVGGEEFKQRVRRLAEISVPGWRSRRPRGKARGGRVLVVRNRRATQPRGMDRPHKVAQ